MPTQLNFMLSTCQLIASMPSLADRYVQFVSDSKAAVSWVNGEDFGNLNLVELIYDVRLHLFNLKGLSIAFRPRGSNSVTDSLAKPGSSQVGDGLSRGMFKLAACLHCFFCFFLFWVVFKVSCFCLLCVFVLFCPGFLFLCWVWVHFCFCIIHLFGCCCGFLPFQ
ncbi:hypothetical protein Ddye_013149 [Dipteronia dyeriana]|uniref:Uncharacterized protein n=1 Tax=Dipteronia dyeriana TaxID=168575 RepID=A0AAE0CJY1_9ROSI|nr:hypothetical protein Ddye_013149 [Dipteronia dyeriana]